MMWIPAYYKHDMYKNDGVEIKNNPKILVFLEDACNFFADLLASCWLSTNTRTLPLNVKALRLIMKTHTVKKS